MQSQLGGLHHVTAVTGNAPQNVAFYTQTLGMRLVKKTVNQDDVSAYHLFYADAVGHPGTDLTFFDWPNAGPNRPGPGTIVATAMWVSSRSTLDWWAAWLAQRGVATQPIVERRGRPTLVFADPEGQALELVAPAADEQPPAGGTPWEASPVPPAHQIRGLHAVRIQAAQGDATIATLTAVMGFREAGTYTLEPDGRAAPQQVRVYEVGPGGLGTEVHVEERADLRPGRVGVGGVHHVAFRTPTAETHQAWQRHVGEAGLRVTPVIDRFYFRSIYYREPGGVLYEIATDGPGFAADEDPAHLGERLALPPFLEPHRTEIEAGLRPLETPARAA
jgi:glyoxalase family protein